MERIARTPEVRIAGEPFAPQSCRLHWFDPREDSSVPPHLREQQPPLGVAATFTFCFASKAEAARFVKRLGAKGGAAVDASDTDTVRE